MGICAFRSIKAGAVEQLFICADILSATYYLLVHSSYSYYSWLLVHFSFFCRAAGKRLAQKEHIFADAGYY